LRDSLGKTHGRNDLTFSLDTQLTDTVCKNEPSFISELQVKHLKTTLPIRFFFMVQATKFKLIYNVIFAHLQPTYTGLYQSLTKDDSIQYCILTSSP